MDVLMAYCDNTTAGIFCRRRRRRRLALPCHGIIYHTAWAITLTRSVWPQSYRPRNGIGRRRLINKCVEFRPKSADSTGTHVQWWWVYTRLETDPSLKSRPLRGDLRVLPTETHTFHFVRGYFQLSWRRFCPVRRPESVAPLVDGSQMFHLVKFISGS